jgi:hypothetical protein
MHIVLKHAYTPLDQLKAWVHAVEVGRLARSAVGSSNVIVAYADVQRHFDTFIEKLEEAGWDVNAGILVPGTPTVLVEVRGVEVEEKKNI